MSEADDVLRSIDQLRRDLSGYHGQLKAHNDLQRHCDRQRERIAELEAIHARDKAENAKLRQMVARMWFMATRTRCTFADRLKLRAEIDELGIEVDG